ncbi:MAG: hypothetical protein HFACDABA_01716 [Anaerolineales bacterium]|nr:hypothetical protein [Anaerolineales bacterium]
MLVLALASLACSLSGPLRPGPTELPPVAVTPLSDQPYQITGRFTVSNDFVVSTYFTEHAVALIDMRGFVTRDEDWEIPVHSQALGFLDIDLDSSSGTFDLNLPLQPEGEFSDVDHDDSSDTGVQIFAVSYSPNLSGGPFSEGDDASRGWPSYLASIITDSERDDEVTGGKLVLWAPDSNQGFPSGFGNDKRLFTADDPIQTLPPGWSFVDLNEEPFKVTREPSANFTLYEPADVALKDFSSQSYSAAFDSMFEIVRKEYAFNDVADKAPDWDALYAEISPRVKEAEHNRDATAYFLALRDFTWAFKDGHVGLNGGTVEAQVFGAATEGGYGFAIRELDDGRVIVTYVLSQGPAMAAGIEPGAQIVEFNGLPILDAIDTTEAWSAPFSMERSARYQKSRYLTRAPLGSSAKVVFVNPGGSPQTATIQAIAERESFAVTSFFLGFDLSALPVEYQILDSNIGYVKINSNFDDLNLIVRVFERALKKFKEANVRGVIIDMRQNSGGAPLGLAGFLTDQEIELGQLQYFSEASGQFEDEGKPQTIRPNENQYRFPALALLVGPACASACELEAYAFSQAPGMIVVGQYPSAGVEAEVARGQFLMPEGFSLQIPTGRFVLPDGSIFLEGQGVPLTVRVPVDEVTARSSEDVILNTAIELLSQ